MLVVEKLPGASTLDVTRGVEAALRDLGPGAGRIQIDTTVFRPAGYVHSAIDQPGLTLLIGLRAAVLLARLFLFSWRAAVVALVADRRCRSWPRSSCSTLPACT